MPEPPTARRAVLGGLLLLLLALPSPSRAAEPGDSSSASEDSPPATAKVRRSAPRLLPDYDGRGPRPPTAGEVLSWPARIALAPLYGLNEFVLRRPLGALVTRAEQDGLVDRVAYMLAHPPPWAMYPTAFIDFGFRASIGVYFRAFEDRARTAKLIVRLGWGFDKDSWRVQVKQEWFLTPGTGGAPPIPYTRNRISAQFRFLQRPDWLFYDVGPRSPDRAARYLRRSFLGHVEGQIVFAYLKGIRWTVEVDRSDFGDGSVRLHPKDIPLSQLLDLSRPGALPGFDGFTELRGGADLNLDTRKDYASSRSGAELRVGADLGLDLGDGQSGWVRPKASFGLHLDLGLRRVISLEGGSQLLIPLGDGDPAPFVDLPSLGGAHHMVGYRRDRLRGPSTAWLSAEYTWPIWVFLEGVLNVEAGGAFGTLFSDFDPGALRLSFGTGIKTLPVDGTSFDLLLGVGTTSLDHGPFGVENVHVVVGVNREI